MICYFSGWINQAELLQDMLMGLYGEICTCRRSKTLLTRGSLTPELQQQHVVERVGVL